MTDDAGRQPTAESVVGLPEGELVVRLLGPPGELVAGAPLRVTCTVVPRDDGAALFLVAGGDRATGRVVDVVWSGTVDGHDLALEDPLAGTASVGGVLGAVPLTPQRPLVQELLVNEYLTLERLAAAVPDGERTVLRLRLRRHLRTGPDAASALRGAPKTAEVELDVPLRGDAAALDRTAEELGQAVREDTRPGSATRDRALLELAALRTPAAARQLAALADHPDGAVRHRAAGTT